MWGWSWWVPPGLCLHGPCTAPSSPCPRGAMLSNPPTPPPTATTPVLVSLTTRKQGPSFAPLGCNTWQLIFFCRIHVCNPHFHGRIPLRPVLRGPAVQTRWLIKGIMFVKQSPTSLLPSQTLPFLHPPLHLHHYSFSLSGPRPLNSQCSFGQPRQVLVCSKTAEQNLWSQCISVWFSWRHSTLARQTAQIKQVLVHCIYICACVCVSVCVCVCLHVW